MERRRRAHFQLLRSGTLRIGRRRTTRHFRPRGVPGLPRQSPRCPCRGQRTDGLDVRTRRPRRFQSDSRAIRLRALQRSRLPRSRREAAARQRFADGPRYPEHPPPGRITADRRLRSERLEYPRPPGQRRLFRLPATRRTSLGHCHRRRLGQRNSRRSHNRHVPQPAPQCGAGFHLPGRSAARGQPPHVSRHQAGHVCQYALPRGRHAHERCDHGTGRTRSATALPGRGARNHPPAHAGYGCGN